MYVRSDDGRCIGNLPISVYETPHSFTKKPWVIGTLETYLAHFDTETDALARMDDVTEWLNAERVYWDDDDVKHVKPRVYEFGKPIGYWRQR